MAGSVAIFRKSPWEWSEQKINAAQLIADGDLDKKAVAREVGVNRDTITQWMKVAEFAAKVTSIRKETESLVLARGIANKVNRIKSANDRWNRMQLIIEERGNDPDMAKVPGGKSGLLVKDIKSVVQTTVEEVKDGNGKKIGDRKHFKKVEVAVYSVDSPLLGEMRKLEEHVAKQVGQWVDKKEITMPGMGGEGNTQSEIDLDKVPIEKLEQIHDLMLMAKPDELD